MIFMSVWSRLIVVGGRLYSSKDCVGFPVICGVSLGVFVFVCCNLLRSSLRLSDIAIYICTDSAYKYLRLPV